MLVHSTTGKQANYAHFLFVCFFEQNSGDVRNAARGNGSTKAVQRLHTACALQTTSRV